MEPVNEPIAHAEIQREGLNVEAAAEVLLTWTDRQRWAAMSGVYDAGNVPVARAPVRKMEHCDEATRKLYKLLVYQVIDALSQDVC